MARTATSDQRPDRRVREPIILVGSGRSGTSLLGELFARHPDVAYWVEPRPIWMHGHAYRSHHELSAADLTPAIARWIDRRFARFLERSGRRRFAEKTPSNCLRIPFIHALYPDCRIVNIIRDGRDVVASTLRMRAAGAHPSRIVARLFETPLWEWPAYAPLFVRTFWRARVLRRPSVFWGVQPRGWRRWLDEPPHVVAARQWKAVVEASIRDGRRLAPASYREIRFETLLAEPGATMRRLLDFTGLPPAPELIEHADRAVDRTHVTAGGLGEPARSEAVAAMQPLLSELGYGKTR